MPALKPYWGKPAVRNFRGDDGNGGIIRSPQRAIVLPDCGGRGVIPVSTAIRAAGFLPPRPRKGEAGARRCCQDWPLLRPPSGSALTGSSTTARWQGRGHLQAGWDVGSEIFLTSKLRP